MIEERFEVDVPGGRLAGVSAGAGPAVVLLHGLGVDLSIWDALFAPLASEYRVIAFDQRGHGRSSAAETPYARHDDVVRVLDALGVTRARLVGSSMGGEVALDTALTHPERVEGLVLFDPSLGGHAWSHEWRSAFKAVRATAAAEGPAAGKRAWFDHPLFARTRSQPEVTRLLQDAMAQDSGARWSVRDPATLLDPPAALRLDEIACPVTIIVGEHDLPDFHAIARTLGEGILGARRIELLGVGHLPMLEAPQRALDLLSSILEDGSPRA